MWWLSWLCFWWPLLFWHIWAKTEFVWCSWRNVCFLKRFIFFGPVKKIYLYIVILSLFRIFCVFLLSNYNTEYIESIYIYIVDNDDFLFFCSFLQILQPTWNKFCLLAASMGLLLSFNNGNYIKLSIVSFGKVIPWNKNKNFFLFTCKLWAKCEWH